MWRRILILQALNHNIAQDAAIANGIEAVAKFDIWRNAEQNIARSIANTSTLMFSLLWSLEVQQ